MTETQIPIAPILLVDDEASWLLSLSISLERHRGLNNIVSCQDSRKVLGLLAEQSVSLVILDLNMPHKSGEELLQVIHQDYPDLPVIILTGLHQIETAVNCMRLGAFDFFIKTTEEERLLAGVDRALRWRNLQLENLCLREQLLHRDRPEDPVFDPIVTRNSAMKSIFSYIRAISQSREPVLICGESGVGKELIAQAIHQTSCRHAHLVAVNVAGLDDTVFSDTLFGHTRGSFTGADRVRPGLIEKAAGGTLFLDEIGDLSLSSQVKLLRLLQEGEYYPLGSDQPKYSEAQIIVATNCDLQKAQRDGRFRKDLYFRLQSHQIRVPALRDRLDDIPLLLQHFLMEAATTLNKNVPTPPPELVVLLQTYSFPGNVRELRAMVFDAVSRHKGRKLSMSVFNSIIGQSRQRSWKKEPCPSQRPTGEFLSIEGLVERHIDEALECAKGNQTIAAGMLGLSGAALSKRLKKRRLSK